MRDEAVDPGGEVIAERVSPLTMIASWDLAHRLPRSDGLIILDGADRMRVIMKYPI